MQGPEDTQTQDTEIKSILVFGAGVLGSLYAVWLHRAGFEVTLLAREMQALIDRAGVPTPALDALRAAD